MMLLTLSAAALLQVTPPVAAPRDTVRLGEPLPTAELAATPSAIDTLATFDSPATRELVERVIRAGSTVPPELEDYRAEMRSAISLSLRADTAEGGELPVTVDELAGEVRWDRSGAVVQRIRGHRVRMLAPTPYTIGSMLENPWMIPHLYGNTIDVFQLAAGPTAGRTRVSRAVHPFSTRGLRFYRYTAGGRIRVRTPEGTTTLVPITVRRSAAAPDSAAVQLVAGSFYVDVDRAAVARARFGFTERARSFAISETGVFFELENGLVDGQFWLPYRQRREIQLASPLFGGSSAIRLVTALSNFELNTGWRPESAGRSRLVWDLARGDSAFQGWRSAVGEETGDLDIADFADLREEIRPPAQGGPIRIGVRYERGDHLFRYNRVEGLFLGAGVRVEPRDPADRDWDVYTNVGWAFAEGVPRGEVAARWHPVRDAAPGTPAWTGTLGAYKRLRETQIFRPAVQWELGYSLGAALAGYDQRDYYDAAGVELFGLRRAGRWTARVGGRYERQDSVQRNTDRSLFGEAEEFPPIAPADPGNHAAVEGELRYSRGTGAFGIGNSLVAGTRAEVGAGDFRIARGSALLSFRRGWRYFSIVGRGDAGTVVGEAPPQFLFRFGGTEGLRGYERNEFGGSTAALGRGRFLLHLPPYSSQPLFRIGFFAMPPLRPALVLSGDAGWSSVSDESRPALERLGAVPTDGIRTAYGFGISIFEDALSAEWVRAVDRGEGRWYFGFTQWF